MHWDLLQCRRRCVPGRERHTCSTHEQQCSSLTGGNERGLCRLDSSAGHTRKPAVSGATQGPSQHL